MTTGNLFMTQWKTTYTYYLHIVSTDDNDDDSDDDDDNEYKVLELKSNAMISEGIVSSVMIIPSFSLNNNP